MNPVRMIIDQIVNSVVQIGKAGFKLKNSSAVAEIRNAADNAYAKLRAADPVDVNDVINLQYLDKNLFTAQNYLLVAAEADCSSALPTNTTSKRIVAVSVAGNGAVLGDVLYDDGANTGNMTIISKRNGLTIVPTASLSTLGLTAYSIYVWNSSTWVSSSGTPTHPYNVLQCNIALETTESASDIPISRIKMVTVFISTAYDNNATITVGDEADADILLTDAEIVSNATGLNVFHFDQAWASAQKFTVTIGNTPTAGAGIVTIYYV